MRQRLRSTIKWGSTVLTVLLLIMWIGSAWIEFGVTLNPTMIGGIDGGCIWVLKDTSGVIPEVQATCEWSPGFSVHPAHFYWWFDYAHSMTVRFRVSRTELVIPLWPLVAPFALLTCWVWWRHLRYLAPGHCSICGYDLRGNTSGACPECGARLGEIPR